jgi:ZIP family zinc transporter
LSFAQTALLGALAGFTIYLGLPVARLRLLSPRARVGLAMFAVGILAFIFVDVMEHGFEIVEETLDGYKEGESSFGNLALLTALLIGGFGVGSAGLGILERRLRPSGGSPPSGASHPPVAGGSTDTAIAPDEALRLASEADDARRRALQTGVVIAVAIGLHNFAEGLAIGVSARAGAISLATVLIIGFALHNTTEGFGIVGPLGGITPSWGWLGLVGLIGGGPTFLGAMLGYQVTSEPLELAFYAVAGGAILYVIGEIWQGMRRYGYRELGLVLLTLGFAAGILTDLVVAYGGG